MTERNQTAETISDSRISDRISTAANRNTPDSIFLTAEQAFSLIQEFGSPLYIYDEQILRKHCREITHLLPHHRYIPHYSTKANSNLSLLRIIREEGFHVDAMSAGEIILEEAAGFQPSEIFMVTNNISDNEMRFAVDRGILMSADSLEQLDRYGRLNPGKEIAVRLNPGIGTGHSDKVITGGSCKFGIEYKKIPQIKEIAAKHRLRIVGLNQHVGSLFLDGTVFLASCDRLLQSARTDFPELRFLDFGGGFGVPYHGEHRLDLARLSAELGKRLDAFLKDYDNSAILFFTEAGRYPVAECGMLLGTVTCRKEVSGVKYIGTDLGFNTLIRPVLYNAYHELTVYKKDDMKTFGKGRSFENSVPQTGWSARQDEDSAQKLNPSAEQVCVVGNICESGDILAKDRLLPSVEYGDLIGVMNAGAYGYSMASNYNSRQRPAEVLLCADGSTRLIRRRDTFEDLLRGQIAAKMPQDEML